MATGVPKFREVAWRACDSWGDYDLQALIDKQSTLTQEIEEQVDFQQFYLEMGALCWRNGLELNPSSIYHKLEQQQRLQQSEKLA